MELDRIHCADARHLREIDDGSVQLIVTSPPYNVGKDYSQHHDDMDLREYLAFLKTVWKECDRVLARGGRLAVNIANTMRKPYVPLNAYIAQQLIDLGLWMRGEIIWDKGPSAGISTAWGSFARASNPTLRDVHEYILVFCKASYKLEESRGKDSGIGFGVAVMESLSGGDDIEGMRSAQDIIGVEHRVHPFIVQFLEHERRAGQMAGDF